MPKQRRRSRRSRGWKNTKESKWQAIRPMKGMEALIVGLGFGLVGGTAIGISMRSAAVALSEPVVLIKEVPVEEYNEARRPEVNSKQVRAAIDRLRESGYTLEDLRVFFEADRAGGWKLIEQMQAAEGDNEKIFNLITQARVKRDSIIALTNEDEVEDSIRPRPLQDR